MRLTTNALIRDGHLEIGDGYRAKNSELGTTGIPFARVGNLQHGFDFTNADRFPTQELNRVGRKISRIGDCVLTTKGSVGRVGFVSEDVPTFVYSPQLSFWRSLNSNLLVPRFLRYWLLGPEFLRQCHMAKRNTDMADYVSLRDQRSMQITLPVVETQRKIAAVLGAYDDLIEVNRRRIRVLEEMAQAIYREWFVNFRYPGHEHDELVETETETETGPAPAGWERVPFVEVADFVNGYAFNSRNWMDEGFPIVKIKELKNGVTSSTPRHDGNGIDPKYRVRNGDLLFSWSAHLDAYLWSGGDALLNQHLFNVSPRLSGLSRLFLYYALRESMQEFRSKSGGTTMQHIKRSALREVKCLLPPEPVRRLFEDQAQPIHDLATTLASANDNLAETRDLLLPRLVSGDLDVSELDVAGVGVSA